MQQPGDIEDWHDAQERIDAERQEPNTVTVGDVVVTVEDGAGEVWIHAGEVGNSFGFFATPAQADELAELLKQRATLARAAGVAKQLRDNVRNALVRHELKARPRRFTGEPLTGFGDELAGFTSMGLRHG